MMDEMEKVVMIQDTDIDLETFLERRLEAVIRSNDSAIFFKHAADWLSNAMRELRVEKKLYNTLLNLKQKQWLFITTADDNRVVYLMPLLHAISLVQPDLNVHCREDQASLHQSLAHNPALLLILNEENKVVASWNSSNFHAALTTEAINGELLDEAILQVQLELTVFLKNI